LENIETKEKNNSVHGNNTFMSIIVIYLINIAFGHWTAVRIGHEANNSPGIAPI
jgi:hypothetical protein